MKSLKKKVRKKERRTLSHEHALVVLASSLMIFASLFFSAGGMKAQDGENGNQLVGVSAQILPNEFNTKQPRKKNFFERVWDNLDPYQQLMAASGAGLGVLLIPLGMLFAAQQKKAREFSHPV